MIRTVPVHNLSDKVAVFVQTDPRSTTWVVSDLKSKLELQHRLLQRTAFLENDAVLRASDLWRKFFLRLAPDYQIISKELAHVVLGSWLRTLNLKWMKSSNSQKTLMVFLDQLFPFYVHEKGEELLKEWMSEHPQSRIRWGSWYELAKLAWDSLNEAKMLPENMLNGALNSLDVESLRWGKSFVFDLGSEISPLETELIQRLAIHHDVTVLRPETTWTQRFVSSEACYERLK